MTRGGDLHRWDLVPWTLLPLHVLQLLSSHTWFKQAETKADSLHSHLSHSSLEPPNDSPLRSNTHTWDVDLLGPHSLGMHAYPRMQTLFISLANTCQSFTQPITHPCARHSSPICRACFCAQCTWLYSWGKGTVYFPKLPAKDTAPTGHAHNSELGQWFKRSTTYVTWPRQGDTLPCGSDTLITPSM